MKVVHGGNVLLEGIHLEREMIDCTQAWDRDQRFMPGRLKVQFRTRDPWFLNHMHDSKPVFVDLCGTRAVGLIREVYYDGDAYRVKLEETRDPKHTHQPFINDGEMIVDYNHIPTTINFNGLTVTDALAKVAAQVGGKVMAPKNKKTPKYYVASVAITNTLNPEAVARAANGPVTRSFGCGDGLSDGYVKHTEAEAIEQAKAQVEKDGIDRYIVKIIRVVRRKPQPVVVESV